LYVLFVVISSEYLYTSMQKTLRTFLFIVFIALSSYRGYTQLISTSLVEDPARAVAAGQDRSNARIHANPYSDTLKLPFFEDFTGRVVPIDSIVISTTDSLVRVYDNIMNFLPDGTALYIGFENPAASGTTDSLDRHWYIRKIGPDIFVIDTSSSLSSPMKMNTNVTITNAYWRDVHNDYHNTTPDTLKWVKGGNTYINNRFPLKPISYNVATFDGLDASGVPYNTTNVFAKGFSDHLTSLPIDLSAMNGSSNLYFSFYWQHGGLGDTPEMDDYILLEFKDNTGYWNTVLQIDGDIIGTMDTFKFEIVPVTDVRYFFNHFQFRFRSYGRLSGPFDIWNIDYIYLDQNRTILDSRVFDMTIGNSAVSFLKNYTAMPYDQYLSPAHQASEIGKLEFTLNNLDRGLSGSQNIQGICELYTEVDTYKYYYRAAGNVYNTNNTILTYEDDCTFPQDSLENQNFPMSVSNIFSVGLNDTTNIFYANNNRYVTQTVLWDYFAYDDGTPEWGVGANQQGIRVANRFTPNIQDAITHIDIHFTRSKGPNMNGRSILLSVWDENHSLLSQKAVQVQYGGYIRYELSNPVQMPAGKPFYVGYQQNFEDLLVVGYDKNFDHSDKVYFYMGNSWNVYNQQPGYVKGSMMIRPVFSRGQVVSVEEFPEETEAEIVLYPVPSDEQLSIRGIVSEIALYDLAGRLVHSRSFDPFENDKTISTASLPNGIYIAELKANKKTIVKKIIIYHQ
jgi:hypothetical protein